MPPASDGKRPDKLLLEDAHLPIIQDAVHRVHKATILATELANLHLRRCLRDGLPYDGLFCKNWLAKVYQEVTTCADGTRTPPALTRPCTKPTPRTCPISTLPAVPG